MMDTVTKSMDYNQAAKLHSKVAGSISRRSTHRRKRRSKHSSKHSSDGSVVSGMSSCSSESIDILSDFDDAQSFAGESSESESYNTPAAWEPIEEDIIKLTVDVPVQYYGDYRTINQSEFFMECMIKSEGSAIVHFFDENNPTSIELDVMLGQMAKKYTACKFLRIDSATTQFVCSKLTITSFPTVLAIRNKVVLDRISEFGASQAHLEKWISNSNV
jgi:hypothetical protein